MTPKSKNIQKRKISTKGDGVQKKKGQQNRKPLKNDQPFSKSKRDNMGISYKSKILLDLGNKRQEDQTLKAESRKERIAALLAAGQGTREEIEAHLDVEAKQSNANSLSALLNSAQNEAREFDNGGPLDLDVPMDQDDNDNDDDDDDEGYGDGGAESSSSDTEEIEFKDSFRKAFDKIYKEVVNDSDVILYVLDARDPEGTRSRQVEHKILAHPDKRLLFVLNKIDLVPSDVLKKWHAHLKLSFPTLPLAASSSAPHSQTFHHKGLTHVTTATALLQALKAYAHASQLKRSISVGVIGYPNVGKSSVINTLLARHGQNKKACPVGAIAGVTTSIRELKVDNKLKILDSPGIVFPSLKSKKNGKKPVDERARLILLGALPPKQSTFNPIPAVNLLLKRLCKVPELKDRAMITYNNPPIEEGPMGSLVVDFLVHVARTRGRLTKGAIPDMAAAANMVLADLRDGRLSCWTLPKVSTVNLVTQATPFGSVISSSSSGLVLDKSEAGRPEEKVVVTEWAKEFSLEGLWDGNFGGAEDDTVADAEMTEMAE